MSKDLSNEVKIAREASITMWGTSTAGAIRYIFNIVIARMLGIQMLGIYALAVSVVNLLTIMGKMGLDFGTVKFVSTLMVQGKRDVALATIKRALRLGLASSMVVALLLWYFSDYISIIIFEVEDHRLASLIRLFLIAIPLTVLANILAGASQGVKILKHKAIGLDILPTALLLASFLLLSIWVTPIWAIGLAFIISQMGSFLATLYYANGIFALRRQTTSPPERGLMKYSAQLSMAAIMSTVVYLSDIFMLGIFTADETVGLYHPAVRTAGMMGMFVAGIVGISGPVISNLHTQGDLGGIIRIIKVVSRWSLIITWPAFLYILLYSKKILLLFGGDFMAGSELVIVLAFSQVILSLGTANATSLMMMGHPQMNLGNNLVIVLVNISLNIILIPRMGPMGAAISSLISLSLLTLLRLAEGYWLYKIVPFTYRQLRVVGAGFGSYFLVLLIKPLIFNMHTVLTLLTGFILFATVFVLLIFMLGLNVEDREVISAFRKKIVAQ